MACKGDMGIAGWSCDCICARVCVWGVGRSCECGGVSDGCMGDIMCERGDCGVMDGDGGRGG